MRRSIGIFNTPPGKPQALTITSFASKDWGPFLTISSWETGGGEFESEVSSQFEPGLTTWFERCDLSRGDIEKYMEHYFWVLPAENFRDQPEASGKVILFFRTECSNRKCVFHWWNRILDTSYRLSRPFFGKETWFVQMVNTIPESTSPGYFGGYYIFREVKQRRFWATRVNRLLRFWAVVLP